MRNDAGTADVSNAELAQLVLQLRAEIQDMKEGVAGKAADGRLARGTPAPDLERRRRASVIDPLPPSREMSLEERVQETLMGRPISPAQLARTVGESEVAIEKMLGELETQGKVTKLNRGGDLVQWVWRPGPNSTNEDRRRVIIGLLMAEPLGNGDLIRITQAKPKQIENDLVEIRRNEPVWWMNKGAGGHGNIYWISPDRRDPPEELDGRLTRKKRQG